MSNIPPSWPKVMECEVGRRFYHLSDIRHIYKNVISLRALTSQTVFLTFFTFSYVTVGCLGRSMVPLRFELKSLSSHQQLVIMNLQLNQPEHPENKKIAKFTNQRPKRFLSVFIIYVIINHEGILDYSVCWVGYTRGWTITQEDAVLFWNGSYHSSVILEIKTSGHSNISHTSGNVQISITSGVLQSWWSRAQGNKKPAH